MNAAERHEIEHACARLINLYATLNDQGRWDDVVALYAPDGWMSRPTAPDDRIVGHEALLAGFTSRPPRTTQHVCGNIVVTVEDASNATATSAMLLFAAADKPPLIGTYSDRFARLKDRWVFTERRGGLTFGPNG